MQIDVLVADASHVKYADEICEEILISARERGTGIARRTPEYIIDKMLAGKAVIAVAEDGRFAGFSYIETWGGKQYVANSGLIVAHGFRGLGLAMRIKSRIFQLSRELYPQAKIFSITTGAAVMKMNYELGFRPVTFAALTDDPELLYPRSERAQDVPLHRSSLRPIRAHRRYGSGSPGTPRPQGRRSEKPVITIPK